MNVFCTSIGMPDWAWVWLGDQYKWSHSSFLRSGVTCFRKDGLQGVNRLNHTEERKLGRRKIKEGAGCSHSGWGDENLDSVFGSEREREMSGSGWCWNKITSWGKHGWHRIDGNQQELYKRAAQLVVERNTSHFFTLPYFCSRCDSVLFGRHLVPHVVMFLAYGVIASLHPGACSLGSSCSLVHPNWSLSCGRYTSFVLRKRFEMSQNLLICE